MYYNSIELTYNTTPFNILQLRRLGNNRVIYLIDFDR